MAAGDDRGRVDRGTRGGAAPLGRLSIVILALLLLAGAVLVAIGIAGGQPFDVLARGVRVCLECIGIG